MARFNDPIAPPSGYHRVAGPNQTYDPKLTLNQIRQFKQQAKPPMQHSYKNLRTATRGSESRASPAGG